MIKAFGEIGHSNTMILDRTPRFVEGYEAAGTGYANALPQRAVEQAEAELSAGSSAQAFQASTGDGGQPDVHFTRTAVVPRKVGNELDVDLGQGARPRRAVERSSPLLSGRVRVGLAP